MEEERSVEEWRFIEECPKYEISTRGRIKIVRTGKIKKPYLDPKHGYAHYSLITKERRKKRISGHRLVATTFIPNPENKDCVHHKDSNRQNNNVENLEWVTRQENAFHASKANRFKPLNGGNCTTSKLTASIVIEIKKALVEGKTSFASIADKFQLSPTHIRDIAKGYVWKHITVSGELGWRERRFSPKETEILDLDQTWKPIEEYPQYSISARGDVIRTISTRGSYAHRKINVIQDRKKGNFCYVLLNDGSNYQKRFALHRLVMKHFGTPDPGSKYYLSHIDNERRNNCIENLKWLPLKGNVTRTPYLRRENTKEVLSV